ncbi:hypothetical protein HDV00_008658 [Rhizophlyctis rosea]|nr:hypothetical protein HDV00_008658 [Rhizophlyctis rosea]
MASPHATPPPTATPSLQQTFHTVRPKTFTSSEVVDAELHKVLLLLLRDYISSWYAAISTDDEFIAEIVALLHHVIRELEARLQRVDWVSLFCRDVPEILRRHLHDYRHCKEKLDTAYAGSVRSIESLFAGSQPHFALKSPETEAEYLRRVVEILMDVLMPREELKSDVVKFLLREILTNAVFVSTVDKFCDPDYINQTILVPVLGGGQEEAYLMLQINDSALSDQTLTLDDFPEDSPITASVLASDSPGRPFSSLPPGLQSSHIEMFSGLHDEDLAHKHTPKITSKDPSRLFDTVSSPQPPSFLKRRRKAEKTKSVISMASTTPSVEKEKGFVSGLGKLASGGLDKIKNIVNTKDEDKEREKDKSAKKEKEKGMKKRFGRGRSSSLLGDEETKKAAKEKAQYYNQLNATDSPSEDGHLSDYSALSDQRRDELNTSPSKNPRMGVFRRLSLRQGEGTNTPAAGNNGSAGAFNYIPADISFEDDYSDDASSLPGTAVLGETASLTGDGGSTTGLKDALDPGTEPELDPDPPNNSTLQTKSSQHSLLDDPIPIAPTTTQPTHASTSSPTKATNILTPYLHHPYLTHLRTLYATLSALYLETKRGPKQLGPIDTTKYEGEDLDEGVYDLLNEVFGFGRRNKWVWNQCVFFVKPVVRGVCGGVVNRIIMKSIYSLICPESVAAYLQLFRMGMWPNGVLADAAPKRSLEEQLATRVEVEKRVLGCVPAQLHTLLGKQRVDENVSSAFEAFQNKTINKHLFYILLDLILVHLVPEITRTGIPVSSTSTTATEEGSDAATAAVGAGAGTAAQRKEYRYDNPYAPPSRHHHHHHGGIPVINLPTDEVKRSRGKSSDRREEKRERGKSLSRGLSVEKGLRVGGGEGRRGERGREGGGVGVGGVGGGLGFGVSGVGGGSGRSSGVGEWGGRR